ncbi:MAG: ParA family protein [Acidobacteriota bacterium]|nr:ParA family protein [Acidobacteriota bacterium]
MAIVAVTGRKGGIGKSTITANLAAELIALKHRVIVLDTDPQQSLVAWAGLGEGVLSTCVEAVDTANPEKFREHVLKAAKNADRVLIDTPPGFADPALLASLLADVVLLPAGPSPLDIMAAREALELTKEARTQRKNRKPIIRFIPSKVLAQTNLGRDLRASLEGLGEKALPSICQRIAVAEAALSGLTISEYAKGSIAHAEFTALAKALEEVIKK